MGPLEVWGRVAGVYRIGCGPAAPARTNRAAGTSKVVLCFGDSITEGFGAPLEFSYPGQLAELLGPVGYQVINLGRSGDTAGDGLKRLEQDVLSRSELPCIVVLGFGGNDLMQRRPVVETFADIKEMVERLHAAGFLVILLGLRGSWLYKVDYHTRFRELAALTGCGLVPVCLDGIWGVPWRMADAAHPNRRGYKMLAERVARELARAQ